MNVLVACEFSGIVREAFTKRGHNAWSCDLLPSEKPGNHYQGDIRSFINIQNWDLLIAHPPCKFLALCQIWRIYPSREDVLKYNLDPKDITYRSKERLKAQEFAQFLWNFPIKKICIENPKSVLVNWLGPKTQTIHPYEFGHGERKETWLWLKNLPPLKPTNIVIGRKPKIHTYPPCPERSSERSKTYQGIAEAMAEQWG